jgi:hypothetical protein
MRERGGAGMPRKSPRVILAAMRTAEARRIVAAQRDLIERLKAAEDPAVADAEGALSTYESALRQPRRARTEDQDEAQSENERDRKPKNLA